MGRKILIEKEVNPSFKFSPTELTKVLKKRGKDVRDWKALYQEACDDLPALVRGLM